MSISIHGHGNIDPNEFSFGNEIVNSQTANLTAEDTVGVTLPEFSITVRTNNGVIIIPPGRMTISQFASAVGQSLLTSHDAIRKGDLSDLYANSKVAKGAIEISLMQMLARLQQLDDLGKAVDTQVADSNAHIQSMKDAIATYNGNTGITQADTDAVNAMNQAITDYNNGTIDETAYNSAVNSYNSYATSRNNDLNATLSTYNTALGTYATNATADNSNTAAINASITDYNNNLSEGETPLSLVDSVPNNGPPANLTFFTLATPSATIPVATLGMPSAPPVVDTFTPIPSPAGDFESVQEQAQAIFQNVMAAWLIRVNLYALMQDILEQGTEYYHFTLQGKSPFNVPAFIERSPSLSFALGGGSGGVLGATLVTVAGDPKFLGKAAQATNLGAQQFYQYKVTLPNITVVDAYTSFLAHETGVLTGGTVMSALGGRAITNPYAERAYGTIFGLTHAQALANITGDTGIDDFIAQFAKTQGIDSSDKEVTSLTGQVKTSLLQTALLSTETSSNLPGLTQAINSLVLPPAAPLPRSLSAVLNDTSVNLFVQNRLGNLPLQELPTEIPSNTQIALQNRLVQQGVSPDEANQIASQALELLRGEQNAVTIQNSSVFDQKQIADYLIQNRVDETVATQVATGLNQTYITNNFEYITIARDLLQTQQVTTPNLAENLFATLHTPLPILTPDQLAQHLYTHTYNEVVNAVGPDQAAILANQSAYALVTGPNSVLAQLQGIKASNTVEDTQLQSIFRDFQSPNLDLFTFVNQMKDPGRWMLHTAATGLMYAGPEPSNFKKSVDILA